MRMVTKQEVEEAKRKMQEATDKYNNLVLSLETYNQLSDAQRLADLIHQKTCHSNHIDQCGYEYESWSKYSPSSSRASYLRKAEEMLKTSSFDNAVLILEQL